MSELLAKWFDDSPIEEVAAATEGEPVAVMPGSSGRSRSANEVTVGGL